MGKEKLQAMALYMKAILLMESSQAKVLLLIIITYIGKLKTN